MYYGNLKINNVVADLIWPIKLIKVLSICIIIVIGAGCKMQSAGTKIESKVVADVLKLNIGPNNPRNSEGDFITLKDGKILYIYTHYTGTSADDNASAYLAGRYSSDEGKTWSQEDVKIVDKEGDMNVMSVSLLRLKNGKIAFFYLKKNSTTDCIPMIRISSDEAKTWSNPLPCITDKKGYFDLNNNRVIQLKNGRLLMAENLGDIPKGSLLHKGSLWSYYSDDNGQSWKSGEEVSNPAKVLTQEPGLVELKNGNILMFIRTMSGVQYYAYSKDKGETWSAIEPSNLKSPCSPASITRIPSTGDLMVAWNDNGINQKRTPLNIAISKDEGKTWIHNKILENDPKGMYCYSAIHFIGKDFLLGYFDWTTRGITIKKINIDWIYK